MIGASHKTLLFVLLNMCNMSRGEMRQCSKGLKAIENYEKQVKFHGTIEEGFIKL